MAHKSALVLSFFAAAGAIFWGNFGSAILTIYMLCFRGWASAVPRPLVYLAMVYSVLQLLASLSINIAASASSSASTILFETNDVLLESLGVFPAWENRVLEYIGSIVPHILILITCAATRTSLTKSAESAQEENPSRRLIIAVAVTSALAAIVYPSIVSAPLFLLAVVIPITCFRNEVTPEAVVKAIGFLSVVLGSCFLVLSGLASNTGTPSVISIPAWVGFPTVRSSDWSRNVRGGIQLLLTFFVAISGKSLQRYTELSNYFHESTTLLRPKPSPETTAITIIERNVAWLWHVILYNLLYVPLLPLVVIAVNCAVFSSLATMTLFVPFTVGVLAPVSTFSSLIPLFVSLLLPAIGLQFAAATDALRDQNEFVSWIFATSIFELNLVELLAAYLIFCLLSVSYYAHTEKSQDHSPLLEAMEQERWAFRAEEGAKDLGTKRKAQLMALVAYDKSGALNIAATFKRFIGRSPRSQEAAALSDVRDFDQHILLRQGIIAKMSLIGYAFKIVARIILKRYLRFLSLFATYVAATIVDHLDVLHGLLLVFFVTFLVIPTAAAKGWKGFLLYLVAATILLTTVQWLTRPLPWIRGSLGTVLVDTVGITKWNNWWEVLAFYIATWTAVMVRVSLDAEYTTVTHLLSVYQFNRLWETKLYALWWHRITMGVAVIVFVLIGLFITKSLLVAMFLVLFLWVCIFTAYQFSYKVLKGLWAGATVYSTCAMLAVSLYQFPYIEQQIDAAVNQFALCRDSGNATIVNSSWSRSENSISCQTQVGVVAPESNYLTLFLLPWFVALVVSFLHLTSKVENVDEWDEPMPFSRSSKHTDQRFYRGAWLLLQGLNSFVIWCADVILYWSEPIYWLSLVGASVLNSSILSMVYAVAFACNAPPILVVFYAVLHILAVYAYQFTFVPVFRLDWGSVEFAQVLGFVKSSSFTVDHVLVGPMLAFFGALLFGYAGLELKKKRQQANHPTISLSVAVGRQETDDTSQILSKPLMVETSNVFGGQQGQSGPLSLGKLPEDHSSRRRLDQTSNGGRQSLYATLRETVSSFWQQWSTFAREELAYFVGYEATMGFLLITLALSYDNLIGAVTYFGFLASVLGKRDRFFRSSVFRIIPYTTALIAFLVEIVARLNTKRLLWSADTPPKSVDNFNTLNCPYYGLDGDLGVLWTSALTIATILILQRANGKIERCRSRVAQDYSGCVDLTTFLLKHDLKDLRDLDVGRVLPNPPPPGVGHTLMMIITTIWCSILPPAIMSFVVGAHGSSALHSILLLAAVLISMNRERLLWRNAFLWDYIARAFYVLLPLCILVFQIPPLKTWTQDHYKVMGVLGFYNLGISKVLTFASSHVFLFLAIIIMDRVFSDFSYLNVLHELGKQLSVRNARHNALVLQMQDEDMKELEQFGEQDRLLREQLDKVRGTRDSIFKLASPSIASPGFPYPKVEPEGVAESQGTALPPSATKRASSVLQRRQPSSVGFVAATRTSINGTIVAEPEEGAPTTVASASTNNDSNVPTAESGSNRKESPDDFDDAHLADSYAYEDPEQAPRDEDVEEEWVDAGAASFIVEESEKDEGPSFCQRLTGAIKEKLEELVLLLSQYSYRKELPTEDHHVLYRLLLVSIWALERQTAFICAVVSFFNYADSAGLWDMLPSLLLISIASVQLPWAPLGVYKGVSYYYLVGLIIKVVLILVASIIGAGRISPVLRDFSTIVFTPILTERTDRDLLTDFAAFLSVMVHIELSIRNGVYRVTGEHDESQSSVMNSSNLRKVTEAASADDGSSTAEAAQLHSYHSLGSKNEKTAPNPGVDEKEGRPEPKKKKTSESKRNQSTVIPADSPFSPLSKASFRDSESTPSEDIDNATFAKSEDEDRNILKRFLNNLTSMQGMGKDLFTFIFFLDFLALLIFTFGYFSFSDNVTGSIAQSVSNNMLPGPMVLVIFLSLILMLLDRVVYTMRMITLKFALHFFQSLSLYIGYTAWRFVMKPTSVAVPMAFLAIKVASLYLSGRQIRAGYSKIRQHDPMTPYPESTIRWLLYIVYRAIPMLYELRTLIDWTFVKTNLTFSNWLLIEDLNDIVYNRLVTIDTNRWYRDTPLGQKLKRPMQFLEGGLKIVAIIFAIMFPLLFYSTFNPNQKANPVSSIDVQLSFGDTSPFYHSSSFVVNNDAIDSQLPTWLARTRPILGSYDIESPSYDTQLLQFARCSIDLWTITPQASRLIYNNTVAALAGNGTFSIFVDVEVSRAGGVGSGTSTAQSFHREYTVNNEALSGLLTTLQFAMNTTYPQGPGSNFSFPEVIIPIQDLYSPFIFNDPTAVQSFSTITKNRQLDHIDCTISLRSEYDYHLTTWVQYWCLRCSPLFSTGLLPSQNSPEATCVYDDENCDNYNFENEDPAYTSQTRWMSSIYYVVFSAHIPNDLNFLPNIGIIAIYTGFVLAFGRVLRGMFTGGSIDIPVKQMKDPKAINQMIRYILLARTQEDFELEYRVYSELILVMRSPETLLELTGK